MPGASLITPKLKRTAICGALGLLTMLLSGALLGAQLRVSNFGYVGAGHVEYIWERQPAMGQGEGCVSVDIDRGWGVTIVRGRAYGPETFPQWPREEAKTPRDVLYGWEAHIATPWSAIGAPWPEAPLEDESTALGVGWPWRALACKLTVRDAPDFTSHTWTASGGVVLGNGTFPGWNDFPPNYPGVLPYLPVWGGLLANTLVFAVAWGIAIYAPGMVKSAVRRRAGQCAGCGYGLEGLTEVAVCPECGEPIAGRQSDPLVACRAGFARPIDRDEVGISATNPR